jgi:capsular exopolysaccharide synthesis family protein
MAGADQWSADSLLRPLQAEMMALAGELERLNKEYEELKAEFSERSKASVDLLGRKRELGGLEETITEAEARANTLAINLQKDPRVKIYQNADVPESSNWKLKWIQIGGACFLVFGCTIVGIALWDYQAKRVNTTKDLDGPGRGIRVVGSLPLLDGHSGHGLWPFGRLDDQALEVVLNFSVDSIRASLLYNRSHEKTKVVMITSAQGQEGRTTVASQLAVSMARSGLRAVLVDADIRNPQQHLVFGVSGDQGFCEVLRGHLAIDQAVQQTAVPGLSVLAAGRFDQASMQALSSERARTVFGDLRSQFDFVLIDVGPVLTSADAMLVGQHVDTALISVRRDVSQLPKIYAAFDRLRSVGVSIMGCVVNGAGTEIRPTELRAATSAPALPEPELTTAE